MREDIDKFDLEQDLQDLKADIDKLSADVTHLMWKSTVGRSSTKLPKSLFPVCSMLLQQDWFLAPFLKYFVQNNVKGNPQ